ncbi:hypothetical protein Ae201684P_001127 [Aphanomyces euteiches]|uniref:Chromodomain-helicase-DNA-binding protein 9 n=1 Tax=Aphanomyces euteiches TaxID=100861 RepID=A0A6G0WQ84_9STRA|nr:hypothetical protein Ae201684_012805 [Aphanomyces euteiches]KAH9097651.1 hypothetical protein Ae201684P_001127 [Aphanomyces euteiches]
MSGRKRNEARMELQELQMDLKETMDGALIEGELKESQSGRRGRRKSAKYEAVQYSKDDEISDDDEEPEKEHRRKAMAQEMNTIRKEFVLDVILGRRIHPKTGSFEYLCKFIGLSHLHMRWLTYEEVEIFFPEGHIKRNKVQAYDKKCLQGGYADTDEVDDLDIGNATVETILSHQAGVTYENLDKKLDERRLNIPHRRKYPRVTDIYLLQNHDTAMERCMGIVRRLMSEPSAEPFLHPVDVSEVPDYLDVIYNPIDFGTILTRLTKANYYTGPIAIALFASDVRLVFANCKEFNAEGSEISSAADQLSKDFERMFYEWIICPSAWKLLPSTGDIAEDAEVLEQFHKELDETHALASWCPWEAGCSMCKSNDQLENMLLCDRCDNELHTHCLDAPLDEAPEEEWFCPFCELRNSYEAMCLPKTDDVEAKVELAAASGANPTYPNVLSAPVDRDTKFVLESDTRTDESRRQSLRLFGNNTMFLVQWKALSIRCSTWERAEDIGDDDAIVRYFKTTKVPTEKEILQTTCQLPCCARSNVIVKVQTAAETTNASNCALDRFCTRGADHDGPCSRSDEAITDTQYGTKEYTHQKQLEQIRAQLFAFHCLLHHHAPDVSVLKRCGAATLAYAWTKEHVEVEKRKEEDQDYSEEEDESSDEEDDDDDEQLPQIHMPAYSQLFLEPDRSLEEANEEDGDEDDYNNKQKKQSPENQVASVLASMVEHVALGYESSLVLVPPKVKKAPAPRIPQIDMAFWSHFNMDTFGPGSRYTEYYVAIKKSVYGLGMRLGLSDDGVARVLGFQRLPNGQPGAAEMTGVIAPGDVLVGINNTPTARMAFKQVVEMIGASKDFVLFTFHTVRPAPLFPPACVAKTIERRYLPLPPVEEEEEEEEDALPPSEFIPFSYFDFQPVLHVNALHSSFAAIENYAAPNGPMQHVLAGIMKGTLDPHEHFASFLPVKKSNAQQVTTVIKTPTEFVPYEQSPTFKGGRTLRSYQVDGLNWMISCWKAKRSCLLADEMGLGKTVQVVSFLEHLRTEEDIRGPFLVVVPLSTLQHWRREIEDWTDMNVCVYHDVGERGTKFSGKDLRSLIRSQCWYYPTMPNTKSVFKFNVLLTTYETILADFEEFESIHWRLLAVDEAHRLKSAGSRVLKQMRVLNVDRKLLLTGTPLQNNTQELWVLLNFLEPVVFDNMEEFNEKYGRLHSQEQVLELQRMLTPYLLRRVKEDVEKSIPPKEETIIQVELTTLQKQYYRAIYEKNRSFLYLGAQNGLPTLNNIQLQLRKCCNHPFLIKGAEERELESLGPVPDPEQIMKTTIEASGKMVLVSKLLPKLKNEGHKVLIFSQFIRQLDLLERYCEHEGFMYERLDGSSYGTARQAAIDRFSKKNSKSFIFLLSTKAGGVGINLIAADTVIIFDSDWNPMNDLQAQSRCHRIGQKKSVKIYRLVTRNSYESEMFDRASRKLGLEHAVLGTGSFSEAHDMERPSAEVLVELLKKGAYGLMDDDDSASKSFVERDIETILKENAHVRVVNKQQDDEDGEDVDDDDEKPAPVKKMKTGLVFDKTSFIAEGSTGDLSVNDPSFWEKVLGHISVEMLSNKLEDGSALASRQTKAKFMAQLQQALGQLVEDVRENKKEKDAVFQHEYEVAVTMLQKLASMKEHFSADQRKIFESYSDQMSKSRVRSCRVNTTSMEDSPVRRSVKTNDPRRTRLKKSKNINGDLVEVASGDVCTLCGEGGVLLLCDGACHRSFHLECVGLKSEPSDAKWHCPDCSAGKHRCLSCGKVGKMGSDSGVIQCAMAKCGRFYHMSCMHANTHVEWVGKKRFRCPSHFCAVCKKAASTKTTILICTHCPQAFHLKCLKNSRILQLSSTYMICSEHLEAGKGTIVEVADDDDDEYDDDAADKVKDGGDGSSEDEPLALSKRKVKSKRLKKKASSDEDDDDKPLAKRKKSKRQSIPSRHTRAASGASSDEASIKDEDEDDDDELSDDDTSLRKSRRKAAPSKAKRSTKPTRPKSQHDDENPAVDDRDGDDKRCILCSRGAVPNAPFVKEAILVNKKQVYVHKVCIPSGAKPVQAIQKAKSTSCARCNEKCAAIPCQACRHIFHWHCAQEDDGIFNKDKEFTCHLHRCSCSEWVEKDAVICMHCHARFHPACVDTDPAASFCCSNCLAVPTKRKRPKDDSEAVDEEEEEPIKRRVRRSLG